MLFSLKIDGFMSAKKSLINNSLPKKFKQSKSESMKEYSAINLLLILLLVGLRKWQVKRALARVPDSGDTFIQLEKVTTTFSGKTLSCG